MVKKLLTLFIAFFVLANASTLSNVIYKSCASIDATNKSKTVRVYQELKNLYIKAIMNDDKKAQIEAIKGLIKCSKILHAKYDHYINELSLLTKSGAKVFKKGIVLKKKANTPSVIALVAYKNKIIITLDRKVDIDDIYFFEINKKGVYRDVIDIRAKFSFKPKQVSIENIDAVRIAQFRHNIIRVVLQNSKPINSIFSIEKNRVIIKVDNPPHNKKVPHKKVVKKTKITALKKKKKYKKSQQIIKYNPDKTIIIDPGHGGKDNGATGYKRKKEKDVVLKIALKLGEFLKKYGYKVYYTRTRDKFVRLRDRTHFANKKNADLFISIHANAAPKKSLYLSNKGIETYFLSPARSERAKRVSAKENSADISSMDYFSKQVFLNFLNREKIVASNKLAIDIQRGVLASIRKKYDVVDGGVRKAPFWVLVGAQMPAVLIEVGYLTNPTEATRLYNPYYESLLAKGIAEGIVSYFEKNR